MNTIVLVAGGIFICFILFGIIKKVIKTIIGLALIIALVLGGFYLYNTYPNEVKNVSDTIKNAVNSSTIKDYLRVDANGKYYVYNDTKTANGKIIYPTGRIFDYPDADINLNNVIDIAKGNFKGFKKQYYNIDKVGNPIVPNGVTPPRKFLQPK
jgi:hypothetical protein